MWAITVVLVWPGRRTLALAWEYTSFECTGAYHTIVVAAVSVSPWLMVWALATSTRGSSDFWNRPKMSSRSVLLVPPWTISTDQSFRSSEATYSRAPVRGTNTMTLPSDSSISSLSASMRGLLSISTSEPSVE